MGNANSTLALLSSSEFKWTAQIQYMETLNSRDEAIHYATEHGCNLIVKYEKRTGPQFDVMLDPESKWTSHAGPGKLDSARNLKGPKSGGRKKRGLLGMFGLTKRTDPAPVVVS